MLTINDNTNTPRNVLEVEDLEAAKCACTTGKIQPLISVTGPLSGTGSLATPVGLAGGTVGQVLTSNGAAQATFQAIPPSAPFLAAGNTGTSQSIVGGDTLSILGSGVLTTVASATDTITASITPGTAGQVLTTLAGVPVWASPAAAFTSVTWNDVTNNLVFTPTVGAPFNVPLIDAVATFLMVTTWTDGTNSYQINNGVTETITGGNDITVVVTPGTRTTTITNTRPAQASACSLGYFTGV